MSNRDPGFDAYVLQIFEVLDRLDYYRLLGVDQAAGASDIKKSFRTIAAKFHPDRNRDADENVRQAIYTIFKRLNEAYRVLCDPERRQLYNDAIKQGETRLDTGIRKTAVPKTPEDTIKSREARQFFRKAGEAFESGNVMQAELHVKMALSREPDSEVVKGLMKKVIVAKREGKAKKKRKKK